MRFSRLKIRVEKLRPSVRPPGGGITELERKPVKDMRIRRPKMLAESTSDQSSETVNWGWGLCASTPPKDPV